MSTPEQRALNAAAQRRYKARHPEAVREADRRYAATFKGREVRRRARSQWRASHPEQAAAQHAAETINKGWLSRGGDPNQRVSWRDVETLWAQYARHCWYCGTDALGFDHAIPVSRGGSNERSNLRVCCRRCNQSKGNRTADDYLIYLEIRKLIRELYTSGHTNKCALARSVGVTRDAVVWALR